MVVFSRSDGKHNQHAQHQQITEELFEQLRHFQRNHTYKHLEVNDVAWRYLRNGQGKETILLLPGAPGHCETSFQQIMWLEQSYSVLSVVYPSSARTLVQIVDGLQMILAAEKITRINLLGISYGGAIAQGLCARMPDLIDKIVFVCTGLPNKRTACRYRFIHLILSLLTQEWIHTLLRCGKPRFLEGLSTLRPFWSTYYNFLILSLTKEDILARVLVWIDFHQSGPLYIPRKGQFQNDLLLIEAENDRVFLRREQRRLNAYYAHAQVYTVPQASHMVAASQIEGYIEILKRFLEDKHKPTL